MWQDKVKEIIDILENSNVNEIEVTFGKKSSCSQKCFWNSCKSYST